MKHLSEYDYSRLTSLDIENRLSQQVQQAEDKDNIPNAAVLIPLFRQENQWKILFIHRSHWVDKHKDQVSFPGGMTERGDKDVLQTALRETSEEIGIPSEKVTLLGQLDPLVFRSESRIYPIVGEIPFPYEFTLSKMEVSHVFSIPLNWLANPKNYSLKDFGSAGNEKRKVYFYKKYEHELLWGISAYLTIQIIEKLK